MRRRRRRRCGRRVKLRRWKEGRGNRVPIHRRFEQSSAHFHFKVDLVGGSDAEVSGKLVMVQRFPESGGGVLITGRIDGLKAGKHGFHVHMKGELGNACKDAGSHFNPFSVRLAKSGDNINITLGSRPPA